MLGPSYRNMQKPPYPGVDLHQHASGTMPMNLTSVHNVVLLFLLPTMNKKWLFKCQVDAQKYAFQQARGRLFVKTDENLQV